MVLVLEMVVVVVQRSVMVKVVVSAVCRTWSYLAVIIIVNSKT